MATTTTVTSNYAGKEAGVIIGKTFKEADAFQNGTITLFPNVNHKLNLRRIRYTDGTTAYTCGHEPAGAITLDERVLDPVKLKNDFNVCKEDFRATWSEDLMGASAHNVNAPSDIMEAITAEVLGQTAEDVTYKIWQGDNSNPDEWDGFLTLFAADAAVIKANNGIVPIAAAVTEANVLAVLKQAIAAIPIAMRRKPLKISVSPDVYQFYMFTLVTAGITNGLGANEQTIKFGIYPIVSDSGLPANTIVIAEPKNLIFGTGLAEDFNTIALTDEDEIGLLTGLVRGKMVYSGGVQYYNSEDIVWYLTTTAVTP